MILLDKTRMALRLTGEDYDEELLELIKAAKSDLGIAGVALPEDLDEICERAIISYVRLHFDRMEDGEYDRLKASYDEQKAQLSMATGYTVWGDQT